MMEDSIERDIAKEAFSPLSQVIHNDLGKATGGQGEITEKNIGAVLKRLRLQVERGITLNQEGIEVSSSVEEVLPVGLLQAIQTDVVCHNEPIPREEGMWGNKSGFFIDPVLQKMFDGDAYDEVLNFQRNLYGENFNVKLVRYKGTLVVVTEHQAGERLRIIQVLDCDFPQTAKYRDFRRKVREENLDPTSWPFAKQDQKETYILAHHLAIEDTKTGKAIDLKTLLPDDWTLRYRPTTYLAFSQDSNKKHLRYSELSSPELVAGFLHEYGHCVFDAHYPELCKEASELWQRSRLELGGPRALPPEVFTRTKELLVRIERGASAKGLQVLRILREQGLDIGVPLKVITDRIKDALASYERGYPGGTTSFVRPRRRVT